MSRGGRRGWRGELYRNLPNIVSVLGVLPLALLLLDDGYSYLAALIIYNNFMDDLDGLLARELNLASDFGARLDNVADAASHILIALVVGAHHGGVVLLFSVIAAAAILIRVANRLAPDPVYGIGTPTNELMRHLLLLVLVAEVFEFDVAPYLVVAYAQNSVSLLAPFAMPQLIRSRTTSTVAILAVNLALVGAWVVSAAAPVVAAAFLGTYLYAFAAGGYSWVRNLPTAGALP